MHMGDLNLEPCPNNYQCDACEVEGEFVREMKGVIEHVRRKA
jgi:hypothetical protein